MEKKIKSHVGIPHCMLKRFSGIDYVWVHDMKLNKTFRSNIKDVGTEVGYYDLEAEDVLCQNIEGNLASFIDGYISLNSFVDKSNYLIKNQKFIQEFIKYQYMRSKKALDGINKYSLSTLAIGDYSPSDLIKILPNMHSNILSMFDGPIRAFPGILECGSFLTNSLGFYFLMKKDDTKIDSFVIPLTSNEAIIIRECDADNLTASKYTIDYDVCEILNKWCIIFEKAIGNGIVIANEKSLLEKYKTSFK